MKTLNAFLANESGATSIEYGMIATLISITILIALMEISGDVHELYDLIFKAF